MIAAFDGLRCRLDFEKANPIQFSKIDKILSEFFSPMF